MPDVIVTKWDEHDRQETKRTPADSGIVEELEEWVLENPKRRAYVSALCFEVMKEGDKAQWFVCPSAVGYTNPTKENLRNAMVYHFGEFALSFGRERDGCKRDDRC